MQTAVLNEVATQKDRPYRVRSTIWTPNILRNAKMPSKRLLSYALMLQPLIARCPSASSVPYVPLRIPKPTAWTMERHEPPLTDRLLKILSAYFLRVVRQLITLKS